MDFCHLPTVTRSKVEYDSVLVVVCCLTGYVRAIHCNERMTSEQLACLFLEQVVSFFGLPKDIFSDNDKIIDACFFSTFCKSSGIEEYCSPVYRAHSNGRAERAVQVVVDSLRKFLEHVSAQKVKHKHTWLDLLPLAIWSANGLPGPIAGYSPHTLLFGQNPVGFGEHPPLVADHGSDDALQFFRRVESERCITNSSERQMQTSGRMCQYAWVGIHAIAAASSSRQNHCLLPQNVWYNAAEKSPAGRNAGERDMQSSGRVCQSAKVRIHALATASSTCHNHCHLPRKVW